jgi:hypothetical protein
MHFHLLLIAPASLFIATAASAEGVSINPGQWEMTSTMTMSMMPNPQVNTVKECIEKDQLDPESFNMDKDSPCAITDVSIDADTASWQINCPTPNGPAMIGKWQMTSYGDTVSGSGTMSAEFSGQKMSFDMTWEGKRIGDCK